MIFATFILNCQQNQLIVRKLSTGAALGINHSLKRYPFPLHFGLILSRQNFNYEF